MLAVPRISASPERTAPFSGEVKVASELRQPLLSRSPEGRRVASGDAVPSGAKVGAGVVSKEIVGTTVGSPEPGLAGLTKGAMPNVARAAAPPSPRIPPARRRRAA